MDIKSGSGYPASALSNFAPHPFQMDGIDCNSMEGFLQALKFESEDMQKEVCKLVGYMAKKKGSKKNWKTSQTLYWRGKEYKRDSKEYEDLLTKAFDRLSTNNSFSKALLATGNSVLEHSIGKSDIKDTILTRREFCRQLTRVREKLR